MCLVILDRHMTGKYWQVCMCHVFVDHGAGTYFREGVFPLKGEEGNICSIGNQYYCHPLGVVTDGEEG